jgi:DNA-directed RNA polymerase specialized sigma24 family protein
METTVETYHEGLFAFALSLAGNRAHAKIKTWLFTTLDRVFLGWKRRDTRLPHVEVSSVESELPQFTPDRAAGADARLRQSCKGRQGRQDLREVRREEKEAAAFRRGQPHPPAAPDISNTILVASHRHHPSTLNP